MTCIKMGSDESHFNVSLTVRDKVTRQCPQTHSFRRERTAEAVSNRRPSAYQPTALPLGQIASPAHPSSSIIYTLASFRWEVINHSTCSVSAGRVGLEPYTPCQQRDLTAPGTGTTSGRPGTLSLKVLRQPEELEWLGGGVEEGVEEGVGGRGLDECVVVCKVVCCIVNRCVVSV